MATDPQLSYNPLTKGLVLGQGTPEYQAPDPNQLSPYRDTLLRAMQNYQKPQAMGMEGAYQSTEKAYTGQPTYQEKDFSGPLQEYTDLRNNLTDKINQNFNTQSQSQQDAMARRFAAMGGLNSGAYIKQSELADQNVSEQRSNAIKDAMTNVGMQEAQTRRGLQQAESQKAFQSGEAEKGRVFSANEAMAQRNFQGQQAVDQRNLQRGIFNAEAAQKYNDTMLQANMGVAKMDQDWMQTQMQLAQDKYNAELSAYTTKHSGGIFGSGGFLGLGI